MKFSVSAQARGDSKHIIYKLICLSSVVTLLCSCTASSQTSNTTQTPAEASVTSSVKEGNPQIAAEAIHAYFEKKYSKDKATQLESVLSALGASAGFGTQMAIREGFIKTGKVPAGKAFMVFETKDGSKYFFGDFLNHGLFEAPQGQITVWSLVGGGAQKAGAKTLPDIIEIVKYNASTIGTPSFGIPRLPKGYQPQELPTQILHNSWNDVQSILVSQHINPTFWGWVPALAAQKLIIQEKDKIEPSVAAKIVMESALPMSKVDPAKIGVPY